MEFSYRISEDDYVRGCKMANKAKRPAVVRTIFFWFFVVICLTLLFSIVARNNQGGSAAGSQSVVQDDAQANAPAPPASSRDTLTVIATQAGPIVIVFAFWAGLFFGWIPYATRRRYRKDTNCHGILTVTLDPQTFALRSSLGTQYQSGWNVFTGWREKNGIVLLSYPNGTFQFVNVSGLSEAEREELRTILTTALPGKK